MLPSSPYFLSRWLPPVLGYTTPPPSYPSSRLEMESRQTSLTLTYILNGRILLAFIGWNSMSFLVTFSAGSTIFSLAAPPSWICLSCSLGTSSAHPDRLGSAALCIPHGPPCTRMTCLSFLYSLAPCLGHEIHGATLCVSPPPSQNQCHELSPQEETGR